MVMLPVKFPEVLVRCPWNLFATLVPDALVADAGQRATGGGYWVL